MFKKGNSLWIAFLQGEAYSNCTWGVQIFLNIHHNAYVFILNTLPSQSLHSKTDYNDTIKTKKKVVITYISSQLKHQASFPDHLLWVGSHPLLFSITA